MISIGLLGAGQFAPHFARLFLRHPDVASVVVTDVIEDRAVRLATDERLSGVVSDFDALLRSDVDAVAIFTQRWTHGPLVVRALRAGKHVYSAVPMATSLEEVAQIISSVRDSGLVYMMGETSYYNPATVFARQMLARGEFGRLFYAEGDYLHDMDLGFYEAYQYSGGSEWKRTASFPPMLYPTHSVGGVLGATGTHAVSVSCLGIRDDQGDGVFDPTVSDWHNDFSNASALFELSDGSVMRINEMRRIGYPSPIRESRFRFFGTAASFEQLATTSVWQTKREVIDVSDQLDTRMSMVADDPRLQDVSSELRGSFASGYARVHDRSRLPREYDGLPDGHEGSHHFLADDFVRAVMQRAQPVLNAWTAARYTVPGIVAHESARRGGVRLEVPDFGDPAGGITSRSDGPRAPA